MTFIEAGYRIRRITGDTTNEREAHRLLRDNYRVQNAHQSITGNISLLKGTRVHDEKLEQTAAYLSNEMTSFMSIMRLEMDHVMQQKAEGKPHKKAPYDSIHKMTRKYERIARVLSTTITGSNVPIADSLKKRFPYAFEASNSVAAIATGVSTAISVTAGSSAMQNGFGITALVTGAYFAYNAIFAPIARLRTNINIKRFRRLAWSIEWPSGYTHATESPATAENRTS